MRLNVGWRDRDYAKWTDEERRRFYGSGATFRSLDPPSRNGHGRLRQGAGLGAVVSLAIAFGALPLRHQLLGVFHAGSAPAPVVVTPPTSTITGLSSALVGSSLSLHGTAPSGVVTVEGSLDGGHTWVVLSRVTSSGGTYAAQIPLTQRGDLTIKIEFADGSTATGSLIVQ